MKILFIGQAPGRSAPRGARAFSGAKGSGAAIARMAGVTLEQFLGRADTVNVFKTWRGRKGKGDAFPMRSARRAALALVSSEKFRDADVIVFVGRGVLRAFDWDDLEPCRPWRGWKYCAFLPHPSGVNHWYNSPANRRLARRFLRSLLKGES